jgi:hypothetical protein
MPRLPTITEVVNTLSRVRATRGAVTQKECEPLFAVLRASYDDGLEDEYDILDDQYTDATDGEDNLQQDVVIAISQLPFGLANDLVSDLITFFESDPQFYELAHALLAITFPITSGMVVLENDSQQDVLAAILANDDIWSCDAMFADCLKQRGLPNERKNVAALLA